MSARLPVSTVLLVRNGMKSLPAYFESMQDIDDIIVLDGGSTDGTVEFLKGKDNCRVFPQNPKFLDEQGYIIDFSALRNEGYAHARHPWILCVDSDETLSAELKHEVERIVREGQPGVYFVRRTFLWKDKPVVTWGSAGYDHVRLFHKASVNGCVKPIHERLDIIPGSFKGTLDAPVFVPIPPASSIRPKFNRFLAIELRYRKGIPFGRWFWWIFLRNCYSVPRMFVSWALTLFIPKEGPRYPFLNLCEQARYSILLTVKSCPLW